MSERLGRLDNHDPRDVVDVGEVRIIGKVDIRLLAQLSSIALDVLLKECVLVWKVAVDGSDGDARCFCNAIGGRLIHANCAHNGINCRNDCLASCVRSSLYGRGSVLDHLPMLPTGRFEAGQGRWLAVGQIAHGAPFKK